MTTSNTQVIAKVAAAVAGFGLVAMSFAAFVPAQAQTTTTTTTTTSSVTFTRDLTIGSTGADVTALQAWLISKGHTIPAGATGYFGMQTRAAVAAFQAANGITPAAGYFGPITRAKVNSMGGSTTGGSTTGGSTGGSTSGSLSGGEADLSDYNLVAEDTTGDEGEEDVEIATAEFDVEDGDIRVERVEVTFDPSNLSLEEDPSDYFDNISVWADGKKIGDEDVENDTFDENNDGTYTITISGLNYIVREGDMAEITIGADISDSIDDADLAQDFDVYVDDEGIRARDAAGIDQYIGDDTDAVSFGFGAEQSGDLTLRTSSDNPDSDTLIVDDEDESDEFTVLGFEIENDDDADALINDITVSVATTSSVSGVTTSDIIRSATLTIDGDDFRGDINEDNTIDFEDLDVVVGGDDTVEGELSVTFNGTDTMGTSQTVTFSILAANVDAEGEESGDDSDVGGTAQGDTFTLVSEGIAVMNGETTSSTQVINTTTGGEEGTFEITFDVEAVDETVYIYKGADIASSTTSGVVYTVYQDNTATTTVVTSGQVSDNLEANDSDNGDTSDYFIVREGDTRSFTLQVSVNPVTTGFYKVELEAVRFDSSEDNSAIDDETYSVPDTDDFETDAEQLNA